MKNKVSLVALVLVGSLQAQTVPVTGTLVPAGAFELANAWNLKGTTKIATNYADLASLPAAVRMPGTRVYVIATDTEYVLGSDTNTWTASDYLLTSEQTLTDSQKIVVRQNIGAGAFFDAAGFAEIRGKTNIVFTGPYTLPVAGVGFGMAAPVGSHVQIAFINTGDNARIWNDTTVSEVELYVPAALHATTEVHIDFWRIESDDRCNLVSTTGDLRSLLVANGTVQKVTLPYTIDVRMGDVVGGHLVYNGANWGAGFNTVAAGSGSTLRYAYSVTLQDGTPWYDSGVATVASSLIPISIYGDAPVFTMIGDSRIDGYPFSNCLTKGSSAWGGVWTPSADPAYLFSQLTGLSVRNEGRSAHDTGEMEARLADIMEAEATYYIFCTGFYNDIYAGRTEAQFLASSTNIINTILAAGDKVIVVPDFPWKDMQYLYSTDTDIQNAASDDWMGDLENLLPTYYSPGDVLWADTRNYMGQERPDTGGAQWREFNRWDLNPLFYYGAVVVGASEAGAIDLLHWSPAGEEACSRAIVSELRRYFKKQATVPQGINSTIDVLADGGTTNRLVFVNGILTSNTVVP